MRRSLVLSNSVTYIYIYVTGSVKTQYNHAFLKFLLNIYNLRSQVYLLAKFQPHMPITSGVTVLQSSNNKKIDLYSKYKENKLQALTKTVVTYQRIEIQSYNFHHRVRHEQGNRLLGKFFFYSLFFTAYKDKIC